MGLFISLFLLSLFLLSKVFFLLLEKTYALSLVGIGESLFLSIFFFVGLYYAFKEFTKKKSRGHFQKPNKAGVAFLSLSLLVILASFYLNLTKVSLDWDAIALYDARSKFLENGMKFSQMTELGKYDNFNKYYYLLYPPFTSIIHFFWSGFSPLSAFPVGAFYSLCLLLLSLAIFSLTKKKLGFTIAAILTFAVSSNSSMLNVAVKEYTNLPFDLYLVLGIFLLFFFLEEGGDWRLLFGGLLISASIWVRYLEPIWIAVLLAYGMTLLINKEFGKKYITLLIISAICLIEYLAWAYFTKSVASNPGFLSMSWISYASPVVGLFTGAPFIVAITIAKAWGIPFLIHGAALLSQVFRWRDVVKDKGLLFLNLIVLSSLLIYFAQFYMLSFQQEWWSIVALSLDRSSTFLIPISGYILLYTVIKSKLLNTKINRT